MNQQRPNIRPFDFQGSPIIQRHPAEVSPTRRSPRTTLAWLLAGLIGLLTLAGVVVANTPTWTGSSSAPASSVPAQFRTPLGCDTRAASGCKDRMIFQRACGLNIDNMPPPQVIRTPVRGRAAADLELRYSYRGEPVLSFRLAGPEGSTAAMYTCLKNGHSVTLTEHEWFALTKPGTEADLPAALR